MPSVNIDELRAKQETLRRMSDDARTRAEAAVRSTQDHVAHVRLVIERCRAQLAATHRIIGARRAG